VVVAFYRIYLYGRTPLSLNRWARRTAQRRGVWTWGWPAGYPGIRGRPVRLVPAPGGLPGAPSARL